MSKNFDDIGIIVNKKVCTISKDNNTVFFKAFSDDCVLLKDSIVNNRFLKQSLSEKEIDYLINVLENYSSSKKCLDENPVELKKPKNKDANSRALASRVVEKPQKTIEDMFSEIKEDYDVAFIIHTHMGEATMLFAYIISALIKKNKYKNPLFILTKKYHFDVVNILYPKAKCIYKDWFYDSTLNAGENIVIQFNNRTHYILFPSKSITTILKTLGQEHVIDLYTKFIDMTRLECTKPRINIDKKQKKTVIKKLLDAGYDPEKLIILCPEALTYKSINNDWWLSLISEIEKLGLQVYINAGYLPIKLMEAAELKFTVEELFIAASISKGVIGLRSGMMDLLALLDIPVCTLYTEFSWMSNMSDLCYKSYNLSQMPFANSKLKEILFDEEKRLKEVSSWIKESL